MELNLNNPLRPQPKKELTKKAETTSVEPFDAPHASMIAATVKTSEIKTQASVPFVKRHEPIASQIPPMTEFESNPELRKAMEILAKAGIEMTQAKRAYVKHTYEIEEDLHAEFHDMYAVLGFKHVKSAINDALRLWCDKQRPEYKRRKGSS